MVLLITCPAITLGQSWQSLNGPIGSEVTNIIVQNDTVYAASHSGGGTIFKKNIHSSQWIYAGTNKISSIKAFTLDKQGNYYAVDREVVFPTEPPFSIQIFSFSEDYGQSWNFLEDLVDMGINEIFIVESGEVLLGGAGIYSVSEDKESFNTIDSSFSVNTFYQYHDTLIAGGFNGLAISGDAGQTWENIGPDTLQVQSIISFGDILFIASNNNIIVKENLNDDGELITNLPETTINVLHTAGNQVYAGTESGILSIDTESLMVNPVFPGLSDTKIFSIDSISDILYTGTDTGSYKCFPDQNSCTLDGVPNSRINTLTFQNIDTLLAGTSNNIQRYSTHSDQWDELTIPVERARSIVLVNNDSLFTISRGFFYNCSFTNSACDSTEIDSGNTLFDITKNSNEDLFLASTQKVFKSQDNGESWNVLYKNSDNNNRNVYTYSDSLLFINTESGLNKYFLNQSKNEFIGFEGTGINDFYITQNGIIYVSAFFSIQKSTDFGETWTTILQSSDITNSGLGGLKSLLYDEEEEKLYAITTMGGVFVSKNEGEQWGVSEELSPAPVEDAAMSPNGTLYLGTRGAGVFINTQPLNPPITITNEGEPVMERLMEFSLKQNYPNPFNPTTAIRYQLPASSEVTLEVFDLLGRRVALLVDGRQPAGAHTVQFDAGHLASGLYLYRLETGNYSETRNMMLVK